MISEDALENLEPISIADTNLNIIDYLGYDLSPYRIIDLEDDEDDYVQRGIASDDRILHIVNAMVVGRYGCDGCRCVWIAKVISTKNGVYRFSVKLSSAIKSELATRTINKKPYKRWSENMRSLSSQLFIWDPELLDEALGDQDGFIAKYVTSSRFPKLG